MLEHIVSSSSGCLVPQIHWHNLDQPLDNSPIVLEDFIAGKSLSIWDESIAPGLRHSFLNSLARFLLDLWSVDDPESTNIPTGAAPYSLWLEDETDRAIRRCIAGTAKWGRALDYLRMRSTIPQFARDLDTFATKRIAHGDTNSSNFMVSEKWELQGYVQVLSRITCVTFTDSSVLSTGLGHL